MTAAVEVVGVAGAGKSTVLDRVVGASDRFRRVDSARGVSGPPASIARSVFSAARAWRRPPASVQVARWWARLGALEGAIRSDDTRVPLFDQGPVYTLARLTGAGDGSDRFEQWCRSEVRRWAPNLTTIVWLDAPDEVLIDRIGARAKTHALRGVAAPDAVAALRSSRHDLGSSVERFEQVGVRVVRLDSGELSVDRLADEIIHVLGRHGEQPSRRST